MSWAETLPAFAVAILVVFGPGLAWGAALGLRRLTLLALAGPFSITAVVVSAEVAALAGVDWSLAPVLAVTVTVGAALWLLRRSFGQLIHGDVANAEPLARWAPVLIAWAVAAVPVAAWMFWMFGVPENIAQSHDNIFHLNALRYISETGNSSSLTLGYLGSREGTFYPAGWHAMVSLVMATAGIPLTAAINVANLVLITGIWSLGCLFLVSRLTGERTMPLLVAAVLSTAYSSFPYLLLEFGVVYPFMLSIAILPAALGVVIQLVGAGTEVPLRWFGSLLLLLGLLPGLLLAHPSSLLSLLALAAPAILAVAYARFRSERGRRRLAVAAGTVTFVVLSAVLWMTVRPARSTNWDQMGDAGGAISEVVFHGPLGRPIALLAAILTAVGAAVVLYLRSHRWVIVMYLVAGTLFVVGSWQEAPTLRWIVAGVWYNDYFRISAMLAPAGMLVASIGGVALAGSLMQTARRVRSTRSAPEPVWFVPLVTTVLVVIGLAVAPLFAVQRAVSEAAYHYRYTEESRLLTSDELALLQRLPEHVPADAVIAGQPLTGAALNYAFAGRRSLLPFGTSPATAEARLIFDELDTMRENPEVCAAVRSTNTTFVLDFGTDSVHGGDAPVFSGLRDLSPSAGFELVDREGDAALYKIVGCP
ncbi:MULTISPECIES: DUF6541 family protein [unclassified Arthrobacter]|uniref:DUF6541 family protein n=1 Tax=unclassified Arthrobacter TaxID=235627 RepID=UPI0003F5E346|nr:MULTISPECIES: DUF6541 family protein [unclassified Arthrobacter]PVE18856.1 hypothetical protein DDA93_07100 [Arthrobacter sp. Bz4]